MPSHLSGVIDACVHQHWRTQDDVTSYMPQGWREFLGTARSIAGRYGQISINTPYPYIHPVDDFLPDSYPAGGRGTPGSDFDMLKAQVLDVKPDRQAAVLSFHTGMFAPTLANTYLALEVCRAINNWNTEQWLSKDSRLYGLVLAPNHLPEEAASEIRRIGGNRQIAGVLMAGNGLGMPFGHPLYHPIYQVASDMDLPIVIHYGGDAADQLGGGPPKTYTEWRILSGEPVMSHVVSCIGQGVFVKFPKLRVLVTGAGVAWVPWMMWRFDANYKSMRREAPWLTKLPSEFLRQHCYFSTWPLDLSSHPLGEAGASDALQRLLRGIDGIEDMLVYASGYPYHDAEQPDEVAARLPEGWHDKVFRENARQFFRFPQAAAA